MNLERMTPLVWTLLWLIIGCQSIGAFVEGGREAALTGGDDQENDQNITPAMSRQATNCYRGMDDDTTKQYQPLELMRDNTLDRDILCDTKTDGGGWIVIQRRTEGDVDFYRNWAAYKHGFGTPTGDFWLGNEAIYELTNKDAYELRIDFNNRTEDLFAVYSSFRLESEADNYRLRLGSHSGTLDQLRNRYGLSWHNGMQFTTYDRDNDVDAGENCAVSCHGAWWYRNCVSSNLNGVWGDTTTAKGITWYPTFSQIKWYHASSTEMKIGRV